MKKIITLLLLCFCLCLNAHQISPSGRQFIKDHEGLELTVDRGHQIGYGHLIKPGEHYKHITKTKAEQLFNQDIAKVNKMIDRLLGKLPSNVKFSQGFIDGLGSLIFNCGESGVARSDFYQRLLRCRFNNSKLVKKDLEYALSAVKHLRCRSRGLKKRRIDEYNLMSLWLLESQEPTDTLKKVAVVCGS